MVPMIEHFRTTFGAIWRHFLRGAKWRQVAPMIEHIRKYFKTITNLAPIGANLIGANLIGTNKRLSTNV